MSWRNDTGIGSKLVKNAHECMRIEDAWCQDDERGLRWWPGELCQRVWADPGLFQHSRTVHHVHCESDLIRGRGKMHSIEKELEAELDHATFSSLAYDAVSDLFRLQLSVYADEESLDWIQPLFMAGAALQAINAARMTSSLKEKGLATPASSGHPENGLRQHPSALLQSGAAFFQKDGGCPSKWTDAEEWGDTKWAMEREALEFDYQPGSRICGKFPFNATGQGFITVESRVDEPHPELGNGLHITTTVPMSLNADALARMALTLSNAERKEWLPFHAIGSWCSHNGQLAHRLFVPNTLYHEKSLPELTINACRRAIWADEFFLDLKQKSRGA